MLYDCARCSVPTFHEWTPPENAACGTLDTSCTPEGSAIETLMPAASNVLPFVTLTVHSNVLSTVAVAGAVTATLRPRSDGPAASRTVMGAVPCAVARVPSLSTVADSGIDPAWRGFYKEAYLFIALLYFCFCYFMSKYSQNLEKRLSTGHRR